jgi:predicted  nucleic acid-binding Zn-ribbon protein
MDSIATLKLLIKLQDIDRDLRRVESHERAIPEILSKRGRQRQNLQTGLEAKHAEIMKARAQFKESEVEMQSRDQQLEKLKAQLNLAKTNQEYTALLDQTKRVQEERGKVEDAGLEILARIDGLQREEQAIKAELDAANREFGDFAAQMEKDLASYHTEHEEIKQQREALQEQLDRQALVLYERVLAARGGKAVVPVEARICQGCYLTATPNDLMNLQAGNLVVCKSCQRILYLPEILGLTKA